MRQAIHEERKVYVIVKRFDSIMAQIGLNRETDGYCIAQEIKKRLEILSINCMIKDISELLNEDDKIILNETGIMIIISVADEYSNNAQEIVDYYENSNARNKKIVYLCIDNSNDITNEKHFSNTLIKNHLAEMYILSAQNTISLFVKKIYTFFNLDIEEKIPSLVFNKLKDARSAVLSCENVTERKWLESELNNWLKSPRHRNIFWLCGEHGSGKTIFISNYFSCLDNVIGKGIYYCHSSSRETQNVERIIKAIAYELSKDINGYAYAIKDYVSDERFQNKNCEELFNALLISPFSENQEIIPKTGCFIFIIDGIDELKTDKADSLTLFLELFRNFASSLPNFIKIIITSPSINSISNTMKELAVKALNLEDYKYIDKKKGDAERFLRCELDNLEIVYQDEDIRKVLEKAEWNFDYLHYFLAQCYEYDNDQLPPIDRLPQGLSAMFELDFNNRFSNDYYNEKVKPILQILAATYEPLSVIDLSQILLLDLNELQSIIKGQLRQFLRIINKVDQGETVSLYNISFEIWLIQKNHKFCINNIQGTQQIVKWFEQKNGKFYKNPYLQKYGLIHALESKENELIVKLIKTSDPDDFEKLKERLSVLFVSNQKYKVDVISELLNIYRDHYNATVKFRDVLVYTYRYILKVKGKKSTGLNEIYNLLCRKQEKIRAELLIGEGIEDYESAKKHFTNTIEEAKNIINKNTDNKWWNMRMLGVAYNRLANLENKEGYTDEAVVQYGSGKECFDKAIDILSSNSEQLKDFSDDYRILQRDEAIINERLGDLAFKKRDFPAASAYYFSYFTACDKVNDEVSTLNSKWDLSISLLRLGDAKRYLGECSEAKKMYKLALDLRRDILQYLRNDCMNIISSGSREYYIDFKCPEKNIGLSSAIDVVPRESRDIDPIRDIAMCYIRLGDLAYCLEIIDVSEYYYEIFYRLCEKNKAESESKIIEDDLTIAIERKNRLI